jgi:endonuclease YncB( thermonuclease family)
MSTRQPLILAAAFLFFGATSAISACRDNLTNEGRLAATIDARTLKLDGGRVIRLAGLETIAGAAPFELTPGTKLSWRAISESDRYGRIVALAAIVDSHATLQEELLASGAAVIGAEIGVSTCMAEFRTAETAARAVKRGPWNLTSAIKNAESVGEDAALVGQFGVFEGKIRSVREQGALIYVNFGTRGSGALTVTVARDRRRAIEAGIATLGATLASLEGRRVRVRGWVENRGGVRIEAKAPEQIEILD